MSSTTPCCKLRGPCLYSIIIVIIIIIIIVIIFINCSWVVTRWQWLFYMYTNMKKKKLGNLSREGYMRSM